MKNSNEFKRFSILFVDDEEMALKYFSQIFSKNFNVITSLSAAEARDILDKQSDEIVVLLADQRMPNESGVKLLKYAREKYPHIIRLLTTAYTDISDAIEAVNSGEIYRFIIKPWDIKELNEHLYSALYLYQAKQHERDLLKEKRLAMFQLAGNIAHELRTPLLSIKSLASGVINYLPVLIKVYIEASKKDSSIAEIRTTHQQNLQNALFDITNEAQHSLTIIDMLMANARNEQRIVDKNITCSMRECINESLLRYPFKSGQKEKIIFNDEKDFMFRGYSTLMMHVFFNLIKNALYAIAENKSKGTINISLKEGNDFNQVLFRDNATGIMSINMPQIFEDFFSTKKTNSGNNIGLGLSFCKHTLENWGGSIECNSVYGSYTEFILRLPIIPEAEQ